MPSNDMLLFRASGADEQSICIVHSCSNPAFCRRICANPIGLSRMRKDLREVRITYDRSVADNELGFLRDCGSDKSICIDTLCASLAQSHFSIHPMCICLEKIKRIY